MTITLEIDGALWHQIKDYSRKLYGTANKHTVNRVCRRGLGRAFLPEEWEAALDAREGAS